MRIKRFRRTFAEKAIDIGADLLAVILVLLIEIITVVEVYRRLF